MLVDLLGKPRTRTVTSVNASMAQTIREIIYDCHRDQSKLPVIDLIYHQLTEKTEFRGSKESLRIILKYIGFRYVESSNNREQIMEEPRIVGLRASFLNKLCQYRNEGRKMSDF